MCIFGCIRLNDRNYRGSTSHVNIDRDVNWRQDVSLACPKTLRTPRRINRSCRPAPNFLGQLVAAGNTPGISTNKAPSGTSARSVGCGEPRSRFRSYTGVGALPNQATMLPAGTPPRWRRLRLAWCRAVFRHGGLDHPCRGHARHGGGTNDGEIRARWVVDRAGTWTGRLATLAGPLPPSRPAAWRHLRAAGRRWDKGDTGGNDTVGITVWNR